MKLFSPFFRASAILVLGLLAGIGVARADDDNTLASASPSSEAAQAYCQGGKDDGSEQLEANQTVRKAIPSLDAGLSYESMILSHLKSTQKDVCAQAKAVVDKVQSQVSQGALADGQCPPLSAAAHSMDMAADTLTKASEKLFALGHDLEDQDQRGLTAFRGEILKAENAGKITAAQSQAAQKEAYQVWQSGSPGKVFKGLVEGPNAQAHDMVVRARQIQDKAPELHARAMKCLTAK